MHGLFSAHPELVEGLNGWNDLNDARLRVQIDEIGRTRGGLEKIPALHPLIRALQFVGRDRRRIDEIKAALAQIVDGELADLRIAIAVVVDEVMHVGALRSEERRVGEGWIAGVTL